MLPLTTGTAVPSAPSGKMRAGSSLHHRLSMIATASRQSIANAPRGSLGSSPSNLSDTRASPTRALVSEGGQYVEAGRVDLEWWERLTNEYQSQGGAPKPTRRGADVLIRRLPVFKFAYHTEVTWLELSVEFSICISVVDGGCVCSSLELRYSCP